MEISARDRSYLREKCKTSFLLCEFTFEKNFEASNRVREVDEFQDDPTDRTRTELFATEFLAIQTSIGGEKRLILIEAKERAEDRRGRKPSKRCRRGDRGQNQGVRGQFFSNAKNRRVQRERSRKQRKQNDVTFNHCSFACSDWICSLLLSSRETHISDEAIRLGQNVNECASGSISFDTRQSFTSFRLSGELLSSGQLFSLVQNRWNSFESQTSRWWSLSPSELFKSLERGEILAENITC